MRYQKFLALIPALMLCGVPSLSQAAFGIGVTVNFAPPVLPAYEQPPLPAPGYMWTPGYWAWDGSDYYWVPGTWVEPPQSGLLWTPGYWGWNDGLYAWNAGYWGPQVGFYGGVNYGYGYGGVGYQGGYWHGGAFFYNRSVANFGRVNIVNVYNAPVSRMSGSRVSFNGGQGGLRARPTSAERTAMNNHHVGATPMQTQHEQHAAGMPAMHMHQNGGHPQILTTQRAGDFAHPGPGLTNHHAASPQQGTQRQGGPATVHGETQHSQPQQHNQPQYNQQQHNQQQHNQPQHSDAMHGEPHGEVMHGGGPGVPGGPGGPGNNGGPRGPSGPGEGHGQPQHEQAPAGHGEGHPEGHNDR